MLHRRDRSEGAAGRRGPDSELDHNLVNQTWPAVELTNSSLWQSIKAADNAAINSFSMGNVAKYLCLEERETVPETPVKAAARGKLIALKLPDERRKLKAVSCISPLKGSFENEAGLKKSIAKKPSIQDYVLYSVGSV